MARAMGKFLAPLPGLVCDTLRVMRLLWLLMVALCAPGQDFTSLEQTVRDELVRARVPGASVAIVKGDRVIYSKGFGTANIETGEAVRPEMLFRLGSTTKMLTATALVGLSLEGKIDLGAPIGKYITGLPPAISTITANQLLSHTAGIHDEAPMYGSHDDSALGAGIHKWTDDWLFTKPGRIYSYANPGYWMAGYLVETLSGKPYADAMAERVFQACGMKQTTLRPFAAMTYPLAQGHDERAGKLEIPRPAADNAASWPAGSVFSCAPDLARYVIAFLNDGMLDGKRAMDPRIFALMSTPHAELPGGDGSYGYGLTIHDVRGIHMVEHSGSRMGYGSAIRMAPEQRVAVIVLANKTGASLPASSEKAMELMVPLKPRATAARRVLEVSADDLRRYPGTYRNGDTRIEVTARDGRLYVKRATGSEVALTKVGDGRFTQEGGAGSFVFVDGGYVHNGGRSFARQ
jgi:CubicO group peptidase (beta-lactamase class C family)